MKTKNFHLGDVLSVTTGRIISPRHVSGVRDILNFMTRDKLLNLQFSRAIDECRPYLFKQFPQLVTSEMDSAIAELGNKLKRKCGKAERKKIVVNWLAKQVAKYGETLAVKPVPKGVHRFKNPLVEAIEMKGESKKVIVVT